MRNTYGFKVDSLNGLARILEEVLQIHWTPRESSFSGEYFLSGESFEELIRLQHNVYELEGWSFEPDYPLLLDVDSASQQKLEEVTRLLEEKLDFEWKLLATGK